MRVLSVAKHLAFGSALVAASLPAQTLTSAERFAHVKDVNSIEGAGLKPWHLKMTFTSVDAAGNPQQSQSLEEWWRDSKNWRRVFTDSNSKATTFVSVEGKRYSTTATASLPENLPLLVQNVIRPVSETAPDTVFVLRHREFGKTSTDCIMVAPPIKGADEVQLGRFPTYCTTEDDTLRLRWLGSLTIVNNKTGKFQGHTVPLDTTLSSSGSNSVQAKVEALGTIEQEAVDLSLTGLEETRIMARISSGVVAGLKISGAIPDYPASARQSHLTGAVVLKAVIGKDGRIHQLEPVSSPDEALTGAAMNAVRTWVYKPYLLEGVPVEVSTSIVVNFNLNGSR